jgi:GGDEF domain-containing protein
MAATAPGVDSLLADYLPKSQTPDVDSLLADYMPKTPEPEPETTLSDRAKDAGITALKGIIAVPETAVGLADIPTGGRIGKTLQENGVDFKRAKDILSEEYSPAQKKAFQNVQEAEGFVPTLKAVAENPSVAAHTILESAPSMLGGAGLAKGAMSVAPKLSPSAAGAIGEGGVTAGQNVEQVRQQTENGLLTPEQTAVLAGSGALTGAITGGAGRLANKLGVGDVNTALIGGQNAIEPTAKNAVRRGLESGLVEAGQETAQSGQEQAASNLALGKDIGEGVGNAAALGAVAGFGMGAPTGALTHATEQPSNISPEEQAVIDQQQGLLAEPENTAGEPSTPEVDSLLADYLPAGTVENTPSEQVVEAEQAEEPENTDDQTILRESQDFVDAYKKAYTPAGRTQQVTKRLADAASKLGIQANRGDSAQSVLDAMEAHIAANKIPTPEERTSEAVSAVTEPLKEHLATAPDGIFNRAASVALDNQVAQPQIEAVENVKQSVIDADNAAYQTAIRGMDKKSLLKNYVLNGTSPIQKQIILEEIQRRSQSQESQNAIQESSPSTPDGGSSAQSEIRQEGGDTAVSGGGFQPSGQGIGNTEPATSEAPISQPTEQLNDQSQNTAPQEESPEKGQEVSLEDKHAVLDAKIDTLPNEAILRVAKSLGIKPRANQDIVQKVKAQHPSDIEAALASVGQRVSQDRRRVDFLSPSERRIAERRQLAREAGLKDEATIEKIVPDESMDAVTGFHMPHDKEPTVKAAMEHVAETGEPAHFIEADIANLGGLNTEFGNNAHLANVTFRNISDIFADSMRKAGHAVLIRHGGDELSAVVTGGTDATIKQAMENAKQRVSKYINTVSLSHIPHPKSKPGAEKPNGVGLYLGQSPIIPGTDLSSIFELSSRELDAGKRGEEYVRRNQTGTTGDIASSGSPSTDNGGPSKKAKRVKSPTGGKRGRAGAATPSEGATEAKPAGITEALLQQPEVHEYLKSRFATQEEAIAHLVNKFGPGINTLVANGTLNFTQGKEDWPGGESLQSDDEAIYFKGKAHIDLAATPAHRLAAVVLHEIGEHYNLRRILGTDGYSSLQKQITNLAKIDGSYAQRIWNEVAQSYDHLEVGGEPFVAEVIAKMGEYAPNAGWFKRLISQIKSFLVTHGIGRGFITGKMGEKDIHDLLRASLASAANRDSTSLRVFNSEAQQSRRLHGIRKSVEDFIVPETPQFEGNMNGVIAMTPREAVSKGVEQLPIKLRVGVATAEHRGFGITHIHDNAIREKDRRTVPGYTSEVAENYARHVSSIAKGFDQIFRDKGHLIFRSSRLQQALVVSKQADRQNGGQVYSVVSIIPAPNTNRWGGVPVWSGKRTETEAQLRTGRNVQSSPFSESDIEAPMFSRPSEPAPRFYSALSKAVEKAPEKVFGNAQQVKVWLVANAPKFDVKKDEIYWSGITDWLDSLSGKVSRAQVSDFLDANGVKVEDKVLGTDTQLENKLRSTLEEMNHFRAEQHSKYGRIKFDDLSRSEKDRYQNLSDTVNILEQQRKQQPKHDNAQLTLPGGVDYRELVVTIPTTEPYNRNDHTHFGDTGEGKQIGWIRHNTRIDANGNKVLFLEEVQSQRSQAGRKLGFNRPLTDAEERHLLELKDQNVKLRGRMHELALKAGMDEEFDEEFVSLQSKRQDILDEIRKLERMPELGIPAAPFVTDSNTKATNAYISLLMKKAISQAIDSDSNSVAWTTGDQQADRYDLSAQVSKIRYVKRNGKFDINIFDMGGDSVDTRFDQSPEQLEEYVGKDLAGKIIGMEGTKSQGSVGFEPEDEVSPVARELSGLDLKIGGAWTQAMYGDGNGLNAQGKPALITQAAMEIARKRGGKIESVPVVIGIPYRDSLQGKSLTPEDQKRMKAGGRLKDQPALIITPEMKEKILSEGMPMFSRPSRSTREAVAEYLPEGLRVAASELQDKKDNLLETLSKEKLAFLSVRQIIESAKSYLPGLKTYEEGMQRRRAMVDPYLHKANQITTIKWKGLPIPARKETGRIMQQSTLRDINVSKDWLGVERTLRGQFKAYSMTEFNGESRTALSEAADQAGAILSDKNSATFATQEEAQQFLTKLHEIDQKQTEKRAKNGWKDSNILRRQSYANLKPAYDTLVSTNPEAAKIYSGTYELHQEIFNARLEALEHRIEESMIDAQTAAGLIAQLRIKFESQSLSWYYAPLKRYGDHWFYGKDAQGENWFMTYESLAARKRAVKNFEAEGGTVRDQGTSLSEMQNAQIGDAVSDNFLKNIHEKIDAADIPIEVSKELQDEIHQMYLATLPDISVRHNAMHRKGTKGFDEDAMRAFANTIHHGASQLANMVEGRNMGESLRDAKLALDIATKTSAREAKRTEMQAAEMLGANWDELKQEGALEELRDNAPAEEQNLYDEAIKLRNKFSHLDIANKVPKALFIAQKNLSEATTARERAEASDALKTAEKIASFWAQYQDPQRVEAAIADIIATGIPEQVKRFRKVQTLWENTVSVGSPEESLERVAVRNKEALEAASHINTENSHKAAYTIEELNKTYNAMVNTSSTGMDQVAAAIRQFDFVMTMGFGLSSGLVNLFQTPVVAMPIAVGKYGVNATRKAFGNTRNEFLKAVINFNKKDANGNYIYRDEDGNVSISVVMEEKLAYLRAHNGDPREMLRISRRLAALRDFKEEGDVSRTNFFDVLGIGREGEDYGGRLQEFNKKMGWMFHHGERMNREITLLAAYDLALNGDPENHYEALEYARKLNNDAHGDYSTENAARIFRGPVAGVVMQYKKYPQAMLYLWGRTAVDTLGYWKKMPRNTPEEIALADARKAEAKEAARSLSALFVMQGAAAGLFGMPLMGAITMVLNALGNAVSDDDEPWDVEKEVRVGLTSLGGETFATAVIKGLGNALTPVNLASRMNLSNIFFQEPLKDLEGKDAATEYLSQVAGPFGGMVKKIADGAKMLGDGEIWRGVESATPKAIGDGMKAIRLAQSGYESMNGEQLKDASAMEVLFQAIGLGSSNMEVLYAERGYNKAAEAAISDARAKLVNKIQKAVTKGEPIPQEELSKWQKDHPSWPITYESIHKSAVRTAKNEQARGIRGYAVNPRLAYLYEQNRLREENGD